MNPAAIRSFLLSDGFISIRSVPEAILDLERVYGKAILTRILRCKTDLFDRCANSQAVLLTDRQLSKLNTLLFIERWIDAEKSSQKEIINSAA